MRIVEAVKLVVGAFAVYGVVVACGSKGGASDPSKLAVADGSRLKGQSYIGSDGSSTPAGVFDMKLGVACSFQGASDGSIRCIPTTTVSEVGSTFADPSCKDMVAYLPSCGGSVSTPLFVATLEFACPLATEQGSPIPSPGTQAHVYPVQSSYAGTLYSKQGSRCVSEGEGDSAHVVKIGAEMPASSFVEGKLSTDS